MFSPDDADALETRAQLRAATTWNALPVLDDCRAALALRVASGEISGEWAKLGRDWRRQSEREREFGPRQYARCQALVCFERALDEAPDNAILWIERAQSWAEIGRRERAEADFDKARELDGDTSESWRGQTQIFHNLRQTEAAYSAYYHGLFAGEIESKWALDSATALRESGQNRPPYQQRAWLDIGVERAPDDVDLRLARAKLLMAQRHEGLADGQAAADFARAIELRPDDPEIYEARADVGVSTSEELIVADYEQAARLRMKRGAWPREVSALTTRARALKNQRAPYPRRTSNLLRAIAFYGVALEIAPDSHTLYIARAKLRRQIEPRCFSPVQLLDSASEDWVAALKLKPQVETARRELAQDLAHSARRQSAHEQLETWLELRELLRARGLNDELIGALVARVQAMWAQDERP